jgi:hypothetical protein
MNSITFGPVSRKRNPRHSAFFSLLLIEIEHVMATTSPSVSRSKHVGITDNEVNPGFAKTLDDIDEDHDWDKCAPQFVPRDESECYGSPSGSLG